MNIVVWKICNEIALLSISNGKYFNKTIFKG